MEFVIVVESGTGGYQFSLLFRIEFKVRHIAPLTMSESDDDRLLFLQVYLFVDHEKNAKNMFLYDINNDIMISMDIRTSAAIDL